MSGTDMAPVETARGPFESRADKGTDRPYTDAVLRTADGLRLHARLWAPTDDPWALLCLVHGLGEHGGRYEPLATWFAARGCAVLAYDQRGHGLSGGPRGDAPSLDALLGDLGLALKHLRGRFPQQPLFLYGHSLGGSVVLNYALRGRTALVPDTCLHGVIASGPWLRLAFRPPWWKQALARLTGRLWPTLTMQARLDTEAMSRDGARREQAATDPLNHGRISARMYVGVRDAGEYVLAHATECDLPLLLMHGGADRLTSPAATALLAAGARCDCTLRIWEGAYHELHNEPERLDVYQTVADWAAEHVPRTPEPHG